MRKTGPSREVDDPVIVAPWLPIAPPVMFPADREGGEGKSDEETRELGTDGPGRPGPRELLSRYRFELFSALGVAVLKNSDCFLTSVNHHIS